jgi:hypothetical protein
MILYVVLYGCETWSLTLREEEGPRVFGNRRIFGQKRDEVQEVGEGFMMRSSVNCTPCKI